MGGVCSPQEQEEDSVMFEQRDMKQLSATMRAYKEGGLEKQDRRNLKSIERKQGLREKMQKFKSRHDKHAPLSTDEKKLLTEDESARLKPARGDDFTRASAERFTRFREGLEEEKRRSRRPDKAIEEKEQVKQKVKALTTGSIKNGSKPRSEDENDKKRSPKSSKKRTSRGSDETKKKKKSKRKEKKEEVKEKKKKNSKRKSKKEKK